MALLLPRDGDGAAEANHARTESSKLRKVSCGAGEDRKARGDDGGTIHGRAVYPEDRAADEEAER